MSSPSGRLLSLLSLLQARRDWSGQELSRRLEVSPRTVRRDVDRLRQLGYPVHASLGPDGGYRLDAGPDLPPLLFDDEQAVAIALALQVAAVSGTAGADAAWRALTTVRQVMPARLRHRIDTVRVLGVPGSVTETDTTVVMAVTDAVRAQEQLRFDYRPTSELGEPGDGEPVDGAADGAGGGAGGPEPPRRVEPHHVLHHGGRWYLLAWDVDRGDWRTFRVDRMTALRTPTGPRFSPRQVPGGDAGAWVAAHFRGQPDPASGD